jgi:YHYH protein
MTETRIKISSVVEGQLPSFVKEEFPLVAEFLSQYYLSLEYESGPSDILQNIDQYVKIDQLTNLTESTILSSDITSTDTEISVSSTYGFPDSYGLLLIDEEIITYTSKNSTTFLGCVRGFSGVTSYQDPTTPDQLVFTQSSAASHANQSVVGNLSILFLKEFLKKVKKQVIPGFDGRDLYSELNESLFIKQSKDFYSSKGTDSSFKILFGALYGKTVEVIKPRDYLIEPSSAHYRVTKDIVVEALSGNPEDLIGRTLYQDADGFFDKARGAISSVTKILRGTKEYYVISLDYDYDKDINVSGTVFGKFSIHPKTELVLSALAGSDTLEVDSTVGFPNSGELILDLSNGITLTITYTDKTVNQFLGCSGITFNISDKQEIRYNAFAYGYASNTKDDIVKVRVTGVLSDLNIPGKSKYYEKNDLVQIKSLGVNLSDYKANDWFINVPVRYDVKELQLLDQSDYTYRVILYDDHNFANGDVINLISSVNSEYTFSVITEDIVQATQTSILSFSNRKSFTIKGQGLLDQTLFYTAIKKVVKVNSTYPKLSKYTANVQNVYSDLVDSLYVAANSLPFYGSQALNINDGTITFSGSFNGTTLNIGFHGLYSGDSIVYNPDSETNRLDLPKGVYFVNKIDDQNIQIARSKDNLYTQNFISVSGTVTDNKFFLFDFTNSDLSLKNVSSQKIIRKLTSPYNDSVVYTTNPGTTGIFINGVELLNYKSENSVYYGAINQIYCKSPGSGYDISNPPVLTITDPIGSGAVGNCSVVGGLERIDIIDPGFDYLEEPIISVVGGNGSGARVKANLVEFTHAPEFNSTSTLSLVDLVNDTIGFTSYHKFRNFEKVIYNSQGQTSIGGLVDGSTYYVSVKDGFTVKLHQTLNDAAVGINTIGLTSYGTGNHLLSSTIKKKKIGSFTILDSGSGYRNTNVVVTSVGVNTSSNTINAIGHGFNSGEIVTYQSSGDNIGGLSDGSYYVTKVSDASFKLSQLGIGTVGIGTELQNFYYNTKQYINFTSTGSGNHTFNYPQPTLVVQSRIGVSTLSGQDFNAVLQPIFRGKIDFVFVQNNGTNYGSEGIINFNKQPLFTLSSGSGAVLIPIVSNGKITEVLIASGGSGYNSVPNLIINGSGSGAVLTPIVVGGALSEVKIISSGNGYSSTNTSIVVESAGLGADFQAEIQSWRVNLVEKAILTNKITSDDGFVTKSLRPEFGLQYSHAYSPRLLRQAALATKYINGAKTYLADLQQFNGTEITSTAHSPIIGWAYDGNPIYGPYGYDSPSGGTVRCLASGYELSLDPNRPNVGSYPPGFFVEDYIFKNSGDLDEHNGRFCITPEYPNGIYAYFCTINPNNSDPIGAFKFFRRPVFPYVIGENYKSTPIDFNYLPTSNQDDIDINETGWFRNTTPYHLINERSYYDYILDPNKIQKQSSIIKSITRGSIDSIDIISGGNNYQPNDSLVFDNTETSGTGVIANVSYVSGKEISQISVASSTLYNVEFAPVNGQKYFIGFATLPHAFLDNDIVTLNSQFDYKKTGNIKVTNNNLTLVSGVGSDGYTGLVTYFNVQGNLSYPNIKENDIYQIANEQVKILNIDTVSSRIRVLRNQNSISGITTYSAGIALTEVTRKLQLTFGISTSYQFDLDSELYFNPAEAVGLGTTSGPGIGYTLTFANPGVGVTQIIIPTQSIYLPNHKLNTGDILTYSTNGGSSIGVSTDGISSLSLTNNSIVYVAKISNDLIGISTIKVGLGTVGSFVGVGSTSASLLYFTSVGIGNTHSFTTNYQNTFVADVSRNLVTVSTATTHGLLNGDTVVMSVNPGITTTFVVSYDDYNRRLLINPKSFTSANVDIDNDTITLPNHGLVNGQKVIHTSSSPSGGLKNESIYYAIVLTPDKIKLSETYYAATKQNPNAIGISSSSLGTIAAVNPVINATKNDSIVFDVSDSSLSFVKNSVIYSAFDFNFYTNPTFNNKFDSTATTQTFEVSKVGQIGIDSTAKVILKLNDYIPTNLYYQLDPINLDINSDVKSGIIIDTEVVNNNKVSLIDSVYNGKYTVNVPSYNSFTYNVATNPESNQYDSTNATLEYSTNSSTSFGGIKNISIKSKGTNYKKLPLITNIISDYGTGANLTANSVGIGSVSNNEILDIGFDYLCDLSMRPTAKLPDILKLQSSFIFKSIGISSFGRNYTIAPSLVVFDTVTEKVVSDIDLQYTLGNPVVKILKNTKGILDTSPRIIPTNNVNGAGISTIRFIASSNDVVVSLASSYSDAASFPFNIGDKVLVEGISVGIGSTAKGYNSESYNYALFTIVNTHPNIGGIGATVSYNLTNYLGSGETPGTYDIINSAGRIIPEKYFPIFNYEIIKNTFYVGENVFSNSASGIVQSWDPNNSYLKVSTNKDFVVGEIVYSQSSQSSGVIESIINFNSSYDVNSSSIVKKGWDTQKGFLDDRLQRIQDNDYYQYFSYSLKSEIPFDNWNPAVSDLNHSAGFKKFSDLQIESDIQVGVQTVAQSDVVPINDWNSEIDLNCVYDFDIVTENSISIAGRSASNQITFESKTLQDYIESIGNRVLTIDDLSPSFNSNPRLTKFSVVDTFSSAINYKKYITFALDSFSTNQRQILLVSLLQNGSVGYLNQYGRVETDFDLGSFDFSISGTQGQLLFYPTLSALNNYDVTTSSYDIYGALSGIGSISLGNSVRVESSSTTLSAGISTSTTIVGIASTYRASKILVLYSAVDGSYYESDELTVIHDGSGIQLIEYGQLTSGSPSPLSDVGIGTYSASFSGSNLNINLTPTSGLTTSYVVNALRVSIGNTTAVSTGTSSILNTTLSSNVTQIAASGSPSANVVAQYSGDNVCAYYVAVVHDKTNSRYQISELASVTDGVNFGLTEFGVLQTSDTSLGTFSNSISGGQNQLTFTPIASIDVQVTVYQHSLDITHNYGLSNNINFTNSSISANNGTYTGTDIDIRKSFNLTYRQNPIFERYFTGNDSNIVNISANKIRIPQNFFVTGEEISYSYSGPDSTNAIGIATTSISGIGLTNKLPTTLYIVKLSDLDVQVAASVTAALSVPPSVLSLSSVGIGTSHIFRSKNQNSKCLISIDNLIQSPIVATSVTTTLSEDFSLISPIAKFSGITSFFGGELVQIDNEIMKITTVGFGSTNSIFVNRGWLGSGISTHAKGSLVSKVLGNYYIQNNVINFSEAPYGIVPTSNQSNRYDEVDYSGIQTSSTFSGRVFLKSGNPGSTLEPYYNNYIFDDLSKDFNGSKNSFSLTNKGSNITGISTSNAVVLVNSIFQTPSRNTGSVQIIGDYALSQNSGITSITFTGTASSVSYDVNTATIPRGGIIVSVGSTGGFGYQPLVAAGGTAIVSAAGTISSISIGNSGSGYRSGIQTVVNVGVATTSLGTPNIEFIGTASVSNGRVVSIAITNPGIGYTRSNPPIVIIDSPLSYSNIPLIYSSSSRSGFGTAATVDIVVGQGSSVINFDLRNTGYAYGQGEILTVKLGGTTGIPTNTSLPFKEFQITIDKTYSDNFSGWTIGDLQIFDSIESLFDGETKTFPLKLNGAQTTVRTKKGSIIDIQSTLLVFINDVLQVPGEGYIFNGGSIIKFPEPPKSGTLCKILFYQGNSSVDIASVDILESVKVGDELTLSDDNEYYQENQRQVNEIGSTDYVVTNLYYGPGLNENNAYQRPVTWCRQTEDKIIDGQQVGKDRTFYEANIFPTTNLIQNLGVSTSYIYVESAKTFFDNASEYTSNQTQPKNIMVLSQDTIVAASATAIVSAAGTISSIILNSGGNGYISAPEITIANPVGLGSTLRASAYTSITSGIVTTIAVTNPGTGYTTTNPPVVLIASPKATYETISNVGYEGDFGILVGVGSTSVGIITSIYFDLYIPTNSALRDPKINPVGIASTGVSGIQTGYYISIYNTDFGNSVKSIRGDGSLIGIGTTCTDNVYQVLDYEILQSSIAGIGLTYVNRIVVGVSSYNGINFSNIDTITFDQTGGPTFDRADYPTFDASYIGDDFYGMFSWGRISLNSGRVTPNQYTWYNQNGVTGISTSPIVRRINPLKYRDYNL